MILRAWLLFVAWYCVWSLLYGNSFAVGWHIPLIVCMHAAVSIDRTAAILPAGPGHRRALVLFCIIPPVGWFLWAFLATDTGLIVQFKDSYYAVTGVCGCAAVQLAAASIYALWKDGK